ncbi:MAG: AAC(3) family N-acetyltransferase [Coprobacillus sp.]
MDAKKLIVDLRKLGVKEDDTIIVHSSYNALKGNYHIDGGPQAVIDALKETVNKGTLMLPTLSYLEVSVEHRYFDVLKTKSCVGILPEVMRNTEGVYRSINPTHSIAVWGKDAKEIALDQQKDFSPVGACSPLHEVKRRNGKIIMLGCGLKCNTSMHGVEEMCVPSYLYRGSFDYEVVLENGQHINMDVLRHDFKGYEQRYDRILDVLSKDDYCVGKVLEAECYVLDALAVWQKGLAILKQNPYYFVDKKDEGK